MCRNSNVCRRNKWSYGQITNNSLKNSIQIPYASKSQLIYVRQMSREIVCFRDFFLKHCTAQHCFCRHLLANCHQKILKNVVCNRRNRETTFFFFKKNYYRVAIMLFQNWICVWIATVSPSPNAQMGIEKKISDPFQSPVAPSTCVMGHTHTTLI